jgi:hypothetical protein
MKVEKAIESLNVLDTKLDLAIAHGFVLVQIGEG